ncbi:hypothetical protein Tco_0741486 [Tanacetum coccineum]
MHCTTLPAIHVDSQRFRRRCYNLIPAESYSLQDAHAQATKTYNKHQDSRIKKAQELTTKTYATLIFKIFLKDIKIIKTKDCQGRLLANEHVGQDTRSLFNSSYSLLTPDAQSI